jgi:MFS family permease
MTRPSSSMARDKLLILAAIFLVAVTIPISFSGPAVAIPAIGRALGGSVATLGWIVNAFMLGLGSTIMLGGALADQFGRKRMFKLGIIAFTAASSAIGLAPNVAVLDLLRGLQGIGGAIAISAGFAALAQEYEGAARTRALGLIGSGFGIGLAFGPLIAGALIGGFGWQALFFASGAAGIAVLVVGVPRLRETRDPGAAGIDALGAASFTGALVALTFGIIQGPQQGWRHPLVIVLVGSAALLLVAFVIIERRQKRPMLDLSLFRYPRFIGAQALPIAVAFSFVVPLILLPIRFIRVEGLNEFQAGLLLLPISAPVVVVPFLAAHLARWIPSGILAGAGLVASSFGIVWLSMIAPGAAPLAFAPPLLLVGIGAGFPWGLMDDLAISVVPTERAGMATGIFSTMRVAGETIAIALVGATLAGFVGNVLEPLAPSADTDAVALAVANGAFDVAARLAPAVPIAAFTQAYGAAFHATLTICAIITFAGALVVFTALRKRSDATDKPQLSQMQA